MGSRQASRMAVVVIAALTIAFPSAAAGNRHPHAPAVTELATFVPGCTGTCGSGSTIGPDGALYVTDGQAGRVLRVDTRSGAVTPFAAGFPLMNTPPGIGGAIDVAFVGHTAYVLVANVGPFFGEPDEIAGIYRVRRNGSAVPVADIGAWATANPPVGVEFVLPGGVQYAMEPYLGGFAVTDGHHDRVLYVRRDGQVRELVARGTVVPTGLAAAGPALFVGLAGPVPHPPENGKVVAITPWSAPVEIASGAPLVVDVEFGPGHRLYALAQGIWKPPGNAGAPASPNTGSLTRVDRHGRLTPVAGPLDRPTSVAFSRRSAFVVTLTGKVMRIDGFEHRRW
jgi:hypothetical protein